LPVFSSCSFMPVLTIRPIGFFVAIAATPDTAAPGVLPALVSSVPDCYAALGVIHTRWRYVPGEFDDYIANPKDNGYRSIHTAVVGPDRRRQRRSAPRRCTGRPGCAPIENKDAAGEESLVTRRSSIGCDSTDWHELADSARRRGSEPRQRIYVLTPRGHWTDRRRDAHRLHIACTRSVTPGATADGRRR
jgi:GTP pyrophosphokinase